MDERRPVTVPDFMQKKLRGERIVLVTAYDYPSACLADRAGVDAILVGDSLAMVVQGHTTTLPVTLDEMIYHVRAVARAGTKALVVGDMPFLSYQAGMDDAVLNAGRLLKEGGASAVKLEGGAAVVPLVSRLASAGIPVAGPCCDGEIQVFHDLLGLFGEFLPRHTKRYAELGRAAEAALRRYAQDVRTGAFPAEANTVHARELEDAASWSLEAAAVARAA